ncbi:MAG: tetratricopeptide repeat protein [Chloroflexota bacterium]
MKQENTPSQQNSLVSKEKTLGIALLGSPTFTLDGVLIEGFNSNKTRAILIYLAVTRQPCLRPTLAGLLWADMLEEKALTNLRKSLLNLRKLVGDYLVITPQTIALNNDASVWIDVDQFQRMYEQTDTPSSLAEAVSLYRDHFLSGFYIRDSLEFEEWVEVERTRWQEAVKQTLHQLITAHSATFPTTTLIAFAQHLLALEPWHEEAHRQLMILYSRSEQPAAAAKQFEQCQTILQDEFGLDASPETYQLQQRIQQVHRVFPAQVPVTTLPLIGRIHELTSLDSLLSQDDTRLVTIFAVGGMGKTRLAQAFAERQIKQKGSGRYWDGVYFVPLASLRQASHIIPALASTLNIPLQEDGIQTPEAQVLTFLREKALLLILDNFEHILDGVAIITKILESAPNIDLIVTSRERLKLREEHVFSLWGLAQAGNNVADADQIPDTDLSLAAQLFLLSAQRIHPEFQVRNGDQQILNKICRMVHGMPLALELAASWVDTLPLADIAAEIEQGLDILATDMHDMPERHRSMQAVFDSAWRRLDLGAQRILCRLSVFRGGFDKSALDAVAQASPLELAQLMSRALLHFDTASQRYRLHELLRQFTAKKLADDEASLQSAQLSQSQHYMTFLATQQTVIYGPNHRQAIQTIEQDIDNIRLAWQSAIDEQAGSLLDQAAVSIAEFFTVRGWYGEAVQFFADAVEALRQDLATESKHATIVGTLLSYQAFYQGRLGDYKQAHHLIQQAMPLLEAANDASRLAQAYQVYGDILSKLGQFQTAKTYSERALAECEGFANDVVRGHVLNTLGILLAMMGDRKQSQTYFQQAVNIAEALQYRRLLTRSKINLGTVYCLHNDHVIGQRYLEEALELIDPIADQLLMCDALNNLGESACETEDYDKALEHFQAVMPLYQKIGGKVGMVNALNGLGRVHIMRQEFVEAEAYLRQALTMANQSEIIPQALQSIMWWGIGQARQAQFTTATAILGFVLGHPSAEHLIAGHAQPVLDELETELPHDVWQKAKIEGQKMTLSTVLETKLKFYPQST